MAKWFKRSKRSGITYTTYLDGKPTTWSQSYKDGSTRTTYTHRGGKITVTKTTKQGGFTKIQKRLVNKKQKQLKYKAWKPRHRVKWGKPLRIKKMRTRSQPVNVSLSVIFYILLFAFSPIVIKVILDVFKVLFQF